MTTTVNRRSAPEINAQLRNKYNLTGVLDRELDKEALSVYFQEDVNKNTQFFHSQDEKLRYLVDNGYYEREFLEKYDRKDVLDLYDFLYRKKFRFKTYIAAKVFYSSYALQSFDRKSFLERYEDRIGTVALYLANGDKELSHGLANDMIRGIYQPATPTFQNSGKKARGELVSCFLLNIQDSLEDIERVKAHASLLSKIGGGVGICLSNVRGRGAPIMGYKDRTKGVLPIAKGIEMNVLYADQLGTRPGQAAVYLHACHYDIIELLDARRAVDNTDTAYRLTDLNIGVVMPDIVYRLASEGKDMAMFCPYDVKRVTGKNFTEISIDEWYWTLYNDDTVRRKYINAEEFHNKLSALQGEAGFPYIVNEARVNELNPIDGRICMSNLCSEILQVSELSELTRGMDWKYIGRDISCNLGSLNIATLFEYGCEFEDIIYRSMVSLSRVSDFSHIEDVKSIVRGNDESHAVGLGVMNYHGFLASQDMVYGDEDSIDFTNLFFMTMRYYVLKASNRIAIERGKTFKGFSKSKYATGEVLKPYIEGAYYTKPISDKVYAIFKDNCIKIPSTEDWINLNESIMEHGIYNQNQMAIAPTGNISYVSNATASIAPITSRIEGRQSKAIGTAYFPMPYWTGNNNHLFKTAYEMDYIDMLKLYAAATPHVDQGISCTLYGTHATTISQLNGMRNMAWALGLKTLYYVRFDNSGDDPTSANSTLNLELGLNLGKIARPKAMTECEACAI